MNVTRSVAAFTDDLYKWAKSGQAMFYVNTVAEDLLTRAVRRVGWQLAPVTADGFFAHPDGPHAVDDASDLADAVAEAGLNPGGRVAADGIHLGTLLEAYDLLQRPQADEERQDRADRAAGLIAALLDRVGYRTVTWDMVHGFDLPGCGGSEDFAAAMQLLWDPQPLPYRCFVVVRDAHQHLTTAETALYRRSVRNLHETNRLTSGQLARHLVFCQPHMRPHEDVRHCLVRLTFPPPGAAEIDAIIDDVQLGIVDPTRRSCPPTLRVEIAEAVRGLDAASIERSIARCVVEYGGLVPEVTDGAGVVRRFAGTLRGMRSRQLSAGQGLRIIDPDDPQLTADGTLSGWENVFDMVDEVILCRSPEAVAARLEAPGGFAVAGCPGSGKTVCAKQVAHRLRVPLVVVNLGASKGSLLGESEGNIARNLETIRAMGRVVVLFDEWDKQAGGTIGSGQVDAGTSLAMLSQVLEFAADPAREAFLIYTMNRLHGPVESLRAGRNSGFFYTPLPDAWEREEILRLKLTERQAAVPGDLARVASLAEFDGLSGAELTEIVKKAILTAFRRTGGKAVTVDDLVAARARITPVNRLNKAEILAMEEFKGIAVPVSRPRETAKAAAARRDIRLGRG